jgi:selenium metabolism protein YedF
MKIIDCRGLACPAPVINVKNALKIHPEIQVVLDDGTAHENVVRFSRNRGYSVLEKQENAAWLLTIGIPLSGQIATNPEPTNDSRILLISTSRLGEGPEELGALLMKNFIHTLLEISEFPSRIFFVNSGVFLTCEGSDVLEALEKLSGMGTEIFSCGLCLDFFTLKDKLQIGTTTNMLTIAESLLTAGHVIKL